MSAYVTCKCGTKLTVERARKACVCGEVVRAPGPRGGFVARRPGGTPRVGFIYARGELKRT